MQEYPKMLYLAGDGGEIIVETPEAEKTARADGYVAHSELSAAQAPVVSTLPAEIAGMGLDELKAYAKDKFGLSYMKIKLETLQGKVAEKLAEAEKTARAESEAAAQAKAKAAEPTPVIDQPTVPQA